MEIWKDIPGYENIYQVSNFGKVKSMDRKVSTPYNRFLKGKLLAEKRNTNGYPMYCLSKNGVKEYITAHQLVAMAFLGHVRCGYDIVVNHKNFIITDNRLENLELVTQRENANMKHKKSSSKYTGVGWVKERSCWVARIRINNKLIHLGMFEDEFMAHVAYEKALHAFKNNKEIPRALKSYSSKYKGVHWNKRTNSWRASIRYNGERKHIGMFKDEYEAHIAYCKAKESFQK